MTTVAGVSTGRIALRCGRRLSWWLRTGGGQTCLLSAIWFCPAFCRPANAARLSTALITISWVQRRAAVHFSLLSQRLACSLSKSMVVPSRSLPHLAFWTAVSNYGQETLQELHRRVIILSPRWQFVTLPVVWSAASHFTYSWHGLDTS